MTQSILHHFQPLLDAAKSIELHDAEQAQRELTQRFDPQGPEGRALSAELVKLMEAGEIANRGELPVRFGRVAKAGPETGDFSIDVVDMNGPGPLHLHPAGEINFCIALEGTPTFIGRPPGWVVETPGSQHVPSVEGGRMLIVYLLPQGQMQFL